MIHIGIDLHSRNMTLVAINDNGKVLDEEKLTNTPANLRRFFECFTGPVQAVVECTSYWYWVVDWCGTHKVPLRLAHAKMLKAISYEKVKTDAVDARTLAERLKVLPALGWFAPGQWWPRSGTSPGSLPPDSSPSWCRAQGLSRETSPPK